MSKLEGDNVILFRRESVALCTYLRGQVGPTLTTLYLGKVEDNYAFRHRDLAGL